MANEHPADAGKQPELEHAEPRSYVDESRRLGMSVLLILPLVLLYQVGIVRAGSATRNLAEVWMTWPIVLLGAPAAKVVNAALIAAMLYGLWELGRRGTICVSYLVIMLFESLLYALLMFGGLIVATEFLHQKVQAYLIFGEVPRDVLLLSLGAGVYEELLFRLLFVGGGRRLVCGFFGWPKSVGVIVLLVASSLAFSYVHHVGSMGEDFDSFVFMFRALCGLALGIIFLTRGLGVAVWTHAIYNVTVLLSG